MVKRQSPAFVVYARKAIDDIAVERREEIDWVLSDDRSQIAAELTPEVLRERLVQRYFQAYGQAWLEMLNSLRWREAQGLADTIDQLTLMTDVRQSPLIALVNTLAYQGQAGARSQALGDSLLQSAQNLIGQDKAPVIDQLAGLPKSPLDESFGPLLALLGKADDQAGIDDSLSLQAFLTRVTRVRLKLQQISTAPDPQAMVQVLAQTVFQGRSVDLTDTQAYGSLMAASLGSDWSGFGQALFVQPLDQAWRKILQPSAAGLNGQWQRAIVTPWNNAFAGRYPFAASGADSSLPMLGQIIRADTGRIDQFLARQLQRFAWPGTNDSPGTRLSWIHARSGERLFGDYPGTWGLIRLLEQAQVTPLDDSESRYRLRLDAPDGLGLTWHLRTELGAGPLALLQLRGFKLPAQIFLDERAVPLSLTQNGAFP
ncbi:ImcF-related family protein [Pseudomonas sp. OTU5201]|uniref:ImcF-related family protein n=1 Tax=Pseudomonas sp. OTU5201 TaxID=3043850 RepID=UPI00313A8F55